MNRWMNQRKYSLQIFFKSPGDPAEMKTRLNQRREGCFLFIDRQPSPRADHHVARWQVDCWVDTSSVGEQIRHTKGFSKEDGGPGLGGAALWNIPCIQSSKIQFWIFNLRWIVTSNNIIMCITGVKNQEETAFFIWFLFIFSSFFKFFTSEI